MAFKIMSVIFAFVFWGGWSYYVNVQIDPNKALLSGMVQGLGSALITVMMLQLVAFFQSKFLKLQFTNILSAVATTITTGIVIVGAHVISKTPDIFSTVFPTFIVGFLFCVYVAYEVEGENK